MSDRPLIENPEFNTDILLDIKSRIQTNHDTANDYKSLDIFLGSVGLGGFILKKMKERGYLSYQDFIDKKRLPSSKKDNLSEGYITGAVTEYIYILYNFLTSSTI